MAIILFAWQSWRQNTGNDTPTPRTSTSLGHIQSEDFEGTHTFDPDSKSDSSRLSKATSTEVEDTILHREGREKLDLNRFQGDSDYRNLIQHHLAITTHLSSPRQEERAYKETLLSLLNHGYNIDVLKPSINAIIRLSILESSTAGIRSPFHGQILALIFGFK
jgi:hypothetical protein